MPTFNPPENFDFSMREQILISIDATSGVYQISLHAAATVSVGCHSASHQHMKFACGRCLNCSKGVESVFCYMDDILVFGKDQKEHA